MIRQVSYYYDPEIGNFYYGHGHPMKPHRVRMAHDLIVRYGLHRHMEVRNVVMGHMGEGEASVLFFALASHADDLALPLVQMLRPVLMSEETMQAFHSKEYIDFLKNVTPENQVRGEGRETLWLPYLARDSIELGLLLISLVDDGSTDPSSGTLL